ncbi:tetratricopeptide repeat protein [Symbiopectobacterium purcellii]|uniref:tetratricopeptide repeat protein n=1 Tax=Symbiopectobacterium purcellii TaxID=2871826 RepID=UPI003F874C20
MIQQSHIDYEKAKYWYEKASAQGNLDAMRALGFMYEKGKVMEVNYTKAIRIYTEAAEKGDYHSHINLWWMYSQGLGVEKNSTIAAQWPQKGFVE